MAEEPINKINRSMVGAVPKTFSVSEFEAMINGRRLTLILDYDGTLAQFVSYKEPSYMFPGIKEILSQLACNPQVKIAIITGRQLQNIQNTVDINNIIFAGNHGTSIQLPNEAIWNHPQLPMWVPKCEALQDKLNELVVKKYPCSCVEDKVSALTFHVDNCLIGDQSAAIADARKVIETAGFIADDTHEAVEGKPKLEPEWGKKEAAIQILKDSIGDDWMKTTFTIFLGDDERSDEPAMKELKEKAGPNAVSFRVLNNKTVDRTEADWTLKDPADVLLVLQSIQKCVTN